MKQDNVAETTHAADELARFEEQGKGFQCRGVQVQDLAEVIRRVEANQRASQRAAARAESARDQQGIERHTEAVDRFDSLVNAVLGVADSLVKEGASRVRTGQVIARLAANGRRDQASAVDTIARDSCGYDLTETIAALPRPCDSEPYKCPRCGRQGHVTKTA